jgi:Domain of unknown function (DUF4186)
VRDSDNVFAALAKSQFRARFHLGGQERIYLEDKGMPEVLRHAAEFIEKRLAPANPRRDGKQTPFRGHPVFIAQHATATCCRKCLEKWHDIPQGRPLTVEEQRHAVAAIGRWLSNEQDRRPHT